MDLEAFLIAVSRDQKDEFLRLLDEKGLDVNSKSKYEVNAMFLS